MAKEQSEMQVFDDKIVKAGDELFSLIILTPEDEAKAIDVANRLNQFLKTLEEREKAITAPLQQALNNARAEFKPRKEKLQTFIAELKQRVLTYKQQAKIKAEEEAAKIEKKLEDGKISEKTAIKKQQQIVVPENTTHTEAGKMVMKKRKVLKIVDPTLIPRQFLEIDETKVKNALKAGIEVPGAILEEIEEMSF